LVYRFLARFVVIAGLSVGGDPAKVDEMVDSISARKRLAESFRHCPKCGADHFAQHASPGELPYLSPAKSESSLCPSSADQPWTK
jgi:hypothetical protein